MNILSPETGSKKMNKNILIVLGGAVMAAVLVAVLVQVTLGGKSSDDGGAKVEVLVAAKTIKKGHELEKGDLTWAKWPEDTVFRGAIVRKKKDQKAHEALKGRLERGFAKGEAVVKRALIKTKGNTVEARLKEGERAISLKVKAEDIVAGFITPGTYVDVILTYDPKLTFTKQRGRNTDNRVQEMMDLNLVRLATETVLQNVRVLALDQKAEVKKDDKVKAGKTVTLAVLARDAEKIALAAEMGQITLAMRGVGDDKLLTEIPTLTDARLTSIDNEIYDEYLKLRRAGGEGADVRKPVSDGTGSHTLTIYNGTQVQKVKMQ